MSRQVYAMIDNLQPYTEYQESGVPWLGEIPAHWEMIKMKRLFHERSEKGHPNEPLLAATQTKGVVRKEEFESRTVLALKDLHLLKLVRVGDFVISLRSFQGGIEYARHQGIISPAYTIFYVVEPSYQGYYGILFKAKPYVDNLSLFVTGIRQGQNIDYGRLCTELLPVPPPEEQTAIVRYLDHVDRRIRRYIRTKQTLMKLLNEQKQIIIQQAVTGGLNLDAPRKDSGVEWLGEVPAHWEEHPAKHFFREIDERSETGSEELLSVSHITGVTPRSQKNITMFMASSYVGHKLCNSGDLVINTMWAWMGALGVAKQRGIVSSSYAVYRPLKIDKFVPAFADHLLRVKPYISEYICRSSGIRSSRLRLYPEKFLTIPILCPPYEEQQQIVAFIEQEIKQFQVVIERTEREIDLMREYRTRLIADVVTGKLDVRAVAARLPDEIDEPDVVDEIDDRIEEDDDLSEVSEELSEE